MTTITLSKMQYDLLKKRALLYEAMLRMLPERKWGIEKYSQKRMQEFSGRDRLDRTTKARLKKVLTDLK